MERLKNPTSWRRRQAWTASRPSSFIGSSALRSVDLQSSGPFVSPPYMLYGPYRWYRVFGGDERTGLLDLIHASLRAHMFMLLYKHSITKYCAN